MREPSGDRPPLTCWYSCARGWVTKGKSKNAHRETYPFLNVFASFPKPKNANSQKHEKQILHIQFLLCFWQLFCEFWLQQGCRARPVLRVATHRIGMAIRLTAVNSCLSPCLGACPTGKTSGEVPSGPKSSGAQLRYHGIIHRCAHCSVR